MAENAKTRIEKDTQGMSNTRIRAYYENIRASHKKYNEFMQEYLKELKQAIKAK